ncbi:GAK system XXXCH domain-containing protein [Desulfonatronum thiodismutans]|uniref:GAK system XXXCH domain-containing protein n=1 Tax=Desulfonatronum thiodismutans TaxID=159290 RepID=UPI0004ABD4C7|nr:GAK system XXXCH domain-containing protein [Desulfonatronum thiodismutans]
MNFPAIKSQMLDLFTAIMQAADSGELPALKDVTSFLQATEKMAMNATEAWHSEAEDFLHLTRQLHMVVKKQNIQESVLILDALQDAQEFCHRSFKPES